MQIKHQSCIQGSPRAYVLGFDLGTSSVKAVAYDCGGGLIGKVAGACKTHVAQPGWQEQDPDQVVATALRVMRKMTGLHGRPAAVAFSSAMHSLIAVDAAGKAISPCLIWSDQRSHAMAEELGASGEGRSIYEATGTPVHPMSPLLKIAWMRVYQPEVFSRAVRFEGIKEYLVRRLFGEAVMDESLASATGLYDAQERQWFGPALDFSGISPGQLPAVVSPFHQLARLDARGRRQTGTGPDTLFVLGASDGCLSNLGSGVMRSGEAVLTIGTSAAMRVMVTGAPGRLLPGLFRYLLYDGKWIVGGGSNSGAVIYEWFARSFLGMLPSSPRMKAHQLAMEGVAPGADGLLFLPHLLGERAPLWNARARGCFYGIGPGHGLPHFHRSVLEGILLNQFLTGRRISDCVAPFEVLFADGGFTRLDSWVQMAADIFGVPVYTLESEDSAARGAALLALRSIGAIDDPESESLRPPVQKRFLPDGERHASYLRQVDKFQQIYARLESTFEGK
jgi:gluconokinase